MSLGGSLRAKAASESLPNPCLLFTALPQALPLGLLPQHPADSDANVKLDEPDPSQSISVQSTDPFHSLADVD